MLIFSGFSSPYSSAKGRSSNADRRNRWASLAKPAIGVALALGALTAGRAQAVVVNVGGQDWDVTTFTGSYNGNSSQFATPANGGMIPWWNNNTLAQQFTIAVAASFGDPGPQFGYEIISLGFPIFFRRYRDLVL